MDKHKVMTYPQLFQPASRPVRLDVFLEGRAFEEGVQPCTGGFTARLPPFFPMGEVMEGGLAHHSNASLIVAPRWVSK